MKILAFLQNQWSKDPEKVKAIYARNPGLRNELIARFLFMGCPTGQRLRRAFGALCDGIIWEEASPEVGGQSSALFRADLAHVRAAIERHRPGIVLAFGKEACGAVRSVWTGPAVYGPHPAARMPDVHTRLAECASELRAVLPAPSPEPERCHG